MDPDPLQPSVITLHYLHRDDLGGGPKAIDTLLNPLAGRVRMHVAVGGKAKLWQLHESGRDWHWHSIAAVPKLLSFITVVELAALLWTLRPDVVVSHGQHSGRIMAAALLLYRKVRTVYVIHWPPLYHVPTLFHYLVNYLTERLTLWRHSWIIFQAASNIQDYLHTRMIDECRADRIRVIPHTVPIPDTKPESGTATDRPVTFLFLGRLVDQKRPLWLLEAWRRACRSGLTGARLLILGDGPMRAEMEAFARKHELSSSVEMPGYSNQPGLAIAACDVVVVTSRFESPGFVALEAMAHGKPVLANDADGVRDNVSDGIEGFLVGLIDLDGFARRAIQLASDATLRRRMGDAGRARIAAYPPARHRDTYLDLFREILTQPITPPP